MPKPLTLAAQAQQQQHRRRLLAAAMAAPVLFQLALHGLDTLLPAWHPGAPGRVLAYAASGLTAIAACMLVARLEAARRARGARRPGRKGLQY